MKSEDGEKGREVDGKKKKDEGGKGKAASNNNEEYDGDDLFDNDSDEE